MTAERARVAVLGGTFDPVHDGHLAIAAAVVDALGAQECWLVPARAPNLRGEPVATAADRRDLLIAAALTVPRARVVDVELRRDGGSYTIDTLAELEAAHPSLELWWTLGADAVRRIGEWHRSAELLARARLAVVQRAGTPPLDVAEAVSLGVDPSRLCVLPFVPPAVSASTVRGRIASAQSIDDLVPGPVAAMIGARGLYRS